MGGSWGKFGSKLGKKVGICKILQKPMWGGRKKWARVGKKWLKLGRGMGRRILENIRAGALVFFEIWYEKRWGVTGGEN